MAKKRQTLRWCTTGILAASSQGLVSSAEAAMPPNIILILTDDQGWSQRSGLMDPLVPESKSDYLETPNMDRIAHEGVRFTSGYAPTPLCTPTRRSILCGTAAARSGTEFPSESGWVPHEHTTVPFALRAAHPEYRTAHFGKWGGRHMISTPEECGYDASSGVTDNPDGGMPASFGYANHNVAPPYFIDDEDPKRSFSISDDSVAFIREQVAANRPFYVQASYYAPHLSVVCRQETLDKYEAKGTPDRRYTPAFAAMMEDLDAGIGQILDVLDELGIADNTYVFFMSDNGGRGEIPGGDSDLLPTNHPLTGSKQSLYEGGIRVPFLVRGPGIPAGSVSREPVSGYDLLPTFFDLAGGVAAFPELSTDLLRDVDGGSMAGSIAPLLFNPESGTIERPWDGVFFHRPRLLVSAMRRGDYKLILNWSSLGAIVSRELYDVGIDPREEGREISSEFPHIADQLEALLLNHLEGVGAYSPPAPAEPGTGEGWTILYANDFSGLTSVGPGQTASVDPGLGYTAVQAELNGAGQLVSTGSIAGSGFRVQLCEEPLAASKIKLTATLRATSGNRWVGIGFHGEDVQKLNDPEANSGPWLLITDRSFRIKGGTSVSGSDSLFQNTHAPGDQLTFEMIYQVRGNAVDVLLNGLVAAEDLPLVHEYPEGIVSDPSIRYLQMQIWNELDDTAKIDRVVVETFENPASGLAVEFR